MPTPLAARCFALESWFLSPSELPNALSARGAVCFVSQTPLAGAKAAAGAGWRLVVHEHIGHGLSSGARALCGDFDLLARHAFELIASLGHGGGPVALCGNSMGGALAMLAALRSLGSLTHGDENMPAALARAPFVATASGKRVAPKSLYDPRVPELAALLAASAVEDVRDGVPVALFPGAPVPPPRPMSLEAFERFHRQYMTETASRVRANLHLSICMSPLGEAFRTRLRNFPSLVNNCTIDYFAAWPEEALRSVAKNTLDTIDVRD